jgi:F0F1-type ATP synthase alpha subunit
MLYLANKEVLADLDKEDVHDFMRDLMAFLRKTHPVLLETINETGQFTDSTAAATDAAVVEFRVLWQPDHEDDGTD